jgi:ATP-dependent DNA ligase
VAFPVRRWLHRLQLDERRVILERVVAEDLVLRVYRLPGDGIEEWAEVQRRGYEGLVAKG